ncbi:MAG TPA: DNA polymerase III subunit alpha, partial [Bacillota bacterium]|nr:DNA polymerase III subunit alpha [Bacillota bacterium]
GLTDGVFQLESSGMKDVLRQLKPTSLEDIVAVNALYRPGPMQYIETFIRRKHGKERTTYLHDDMAPILKKTYGVLVYQEQMMQIVRHFTGMTLGEADIFRRALSSKNEEQIPKAKAQFIKGCQRQGYSKNEAEDIYHWLKKFSNYSFNRSHAVAYSKISYQLAYLKAHYPAYFFAELLTTSVTNQRRLNKYVMDMRKRNIDLLPPSINRSFGRFIVEKGNIRMGLLAIKGVGYQAMREIINKRQDGPFKSLFDFCFRISLQTVNRQMIEHLIKVGVFDEFLSNRASLLATLDDAINQAELFKEFQEQPSFLEDQFDFTETYAEREDFSQMEKLAFERDYLGLYSSSHPLKDRRDLLARQGYYTLLEAADRQGQTSIKSVAIIQSVRKIRTRRGDQMAFLMLSDEFFEMDAVVFPNLFQKVQSWLNEDIFVKVIGKTETRNNQLQFVIQTMEQYPLKTLEQTKEQLFIKITSHSHREVLSMIKRIAKKYPGLTPVYVYVAKEKQTYKLSETYQLKVNDECLQWLQNEFGKDYVVLKK